MTNYLIPQKQCSMGQLSPNQPFESDGQSSDDSMDDSGKRKQVSKRLKSPPDKIGARNTIRKAKSPATKLPEKMQDARKRYGSRDKKT